MKYLFFLLLPLTLFADTSNAQHNAQLLGALTLIPPFVAIILAFVTKNVIFSLFIGAFSGTYLISITNNGFLHAFYDAFLNFCQRAVGSLADPWNAGIVLQVLTIGGMIAVITKMGGARAIAEKLATKAKTQRSAQFYSWIMGFFIFFDDYANSLIIGPIMRPVNDKLHVSREKLAFIIDATAAPIAGIALISTWVGYEISLIKDAYASIGQLNINAYEIFVETIPYRFYNILMLAFVFFTIYYLREFGPMYKAANRAIKTGQVSHPDASPLMTQESSTLEPKACVKHSIWNAIVPILTLIVIAFIGFYYNGISALEGEALQKVLAHPYAFSSLRDAFGAADASVVLFQAALFASIVAIAMGMYQKLFDSLSEALETWVFGVKALVITGVILILAWSISSVMKELGTSIYLVSILTDTTPQVLLPSIIFILGSIISFATGTSYGTMGILMPLTIPIANAIGLHVGLEATQLHSYIVLNASAVLTGAIFGDHCSPISDTSILSSMGSSCDHMDHIRTQLAYAIFIGIVTVFLGYLPAAFGVPVYIILPISLIFIALFVRFYGKEIKK
jgi:Na+/H+ antiporter NhaC